MKYSDYKKDNDVNDFIKYFVLKLKNWDKNHWLAKERRQFEVKDIEGACANYYWPASFKNPGQNSSIGIFTCDDWDSTKKVMNDLYAGLKQSLEQNNDENILEWCDAILKWGMGGRGEATLKRLRKCAKAGNLSKCLHHIVNELNDDNLSLDGLNEKLLIGFNGLEHQPWMSSGLAKIISFSANNIIIMDSRVGAAICECVNDFLNKNAKNEIPCSLEFAWAPASYDHKRFKEPVNRREPKPFNIYTNHPRFKNDLSWLRTQLKASWLLRAVLEEADDLFSGFNLKERLNMLEAGLFMIGYNLDNNDQRSYRTKAASLRRISEETVRKTIKQKEWNNFSLGTLYIRNVPLEAKNCVPTVVSVNRAIDRARGNTSPKNGEKCLLKGLGLLNNNDTLMQMGNLEKRKEFLAKRFDQQNVYPKQILATFLIGEFYRNFPEANKDSLINWLIADGYANTQNPNGQGAANLYSAGRSFGIYFGLLKDTNRPTKFFFKFFGVPSLCAEKIHLEIS